MEKIYEIQEMLIAERDKRNELSTKYNRGVNNIGVIDNCLGVTAIGLGITGVRLLAAIVAAPAVIGMEAVSFQSFLKITDPKKRDIIVNEFLKTRQNIQQNFRSKLVSDLNTQYEEDAVIGDIVDLRKFASVPGADKTFLHWVKGNKNKEKQCNHWL